MNYKTKAKIQTIIFYTLTILCMAVCGGFIGFWVENFAESIGNKLNALIIGILMIAGLAFIFLCYWISLCLHETGHMIFGLMSGYKFRSIRFGTLIFTKENGKLKVGKYNMPGTGGQCLMEVPDGNPEDMPIVLYNMGGLFVNLFLFVINGILTFCLFDISSLAADLFAVFALTNITIFITSGIPLTELGNDGANTLILCKNKTAKVAFSNSLKVVELMSKGIAISDMPEELFEFDRNVLLDNPITTSQAVNYFNYLLNVGHYNEATEMGEYILANARSINQLHEKIMNGELMYIAAVIDHDTEKAKNLFEKNKKQFKSIAGFISMQRYYYAYYILVEPDEKKAAKYRKMFEKTIKSYPNKIDAENEQKLFDLIISG